MMQTVGLPFFLGVSARIDEAPCLTIDLINLHYCLVVVDVDRPKPRVTPTPSKANRYAGVIQPDNLWSIGAAFETGYFRATT
jgi:hypothetical protein